MNRTTGSLSIGFELVLAFALLMRALMAIEANAATNYVADLGGSDANDGSSWAQAFKTISNAVARTGDGLVTNVVTVSNGTYTLTSQISVTNGITVQSLNGFSNTFVNGNYPVVTNRCFYLAHTNAVVEGFTVSNGVSTASGGGVYIEGGTLRNCIIRYNLVTTSYNSKGAGVGVTNGAVLDCVISENFATNTTYGGGAYIGPAGLASNCVIQNNVARRNGGGVYIEGGMVRNCTIISNYVSDTWGGGVWLGSGTIQDCLIASNKVVNYGGGVYMTNGTVLSCVILSNQVNSGGGGVDMTGGMLLNCTIVSNVVGFQLGGGIRIAGGIVSNCAIRNNQGFRYGAGVCMGGGMLYNCTISGNVLLDEGGGGGVYMTNGILRNCLISKNSESYIFAAGGGGGVRLIGGSVQNCTIVSNTAGSIFSTTGGGGVWMANGAFVQNTIIYFNACPAGSSNYYNDTSGSYSNCNLSPTLTDGSTNFSANNITNDPLLVNLAEGNYRLTSDSPCVNAGTNQDWMAGANDLAGQRRIDRLFGWVDIGAYEHLYSATLFTIP